MRAKEPRGQDLQGIVEIRRDPRHLWPVRPSDALLHSKPTCPARSRRCRPCSPPRPLYSRLFRSPAGGSGYNITAGAYSYGGGDGPYGSGGYGYGYGDCSYGGGAYSYGGSDGGHSDGDYSGGPYNHGGYGGASCEAVPVGQSPGGGAGGAGYDIPSRPPAASDRGYLRAIQQAGDGGHGVAFAAEDGGHEDEGYSGGPLSSVFRGPESGPGPTTYVLQLPTSEMRFFPQVMSAVFASRRLGATTVIGDSGASRHTFGDGTHVRNKHLPAAEEVYLISGDGERLPVACYGDLDLFLHCKRYGKPWSNVRVTLKNVAMVSGIWFDRISFNQIQETHPVLLDKEGAHILGGEFSSPSTPTGTTCKRPKWPIMAHPPFTVTPGCRRSPSPAASSFLPP